MQRLLLLSVFLLFIVLKVDAQKILSNKADSVAKNSKVLDTTKRRSTDTVKGYVNLGKIQGRQAAISSALLPGLGQIKNGVTFYRLLKVAGIYTGGTLLTLSYIDNNKNYHIFLSELQYRVEHNNESPPGSLYTKYERDGLITAKDLYRRNREVVIFSLVGLYFLNIVEAYIDARLKYFDVDDNNVFRISPSLLNTNTMYGYQPVTPGLKFTFTF